MGTSQPGEGESKSCCSVLVPMSEDGIWVCLAKRRAGYLQPGGFLASAEPRVMEPVPDFTWFPAACPFAQIHKAEGNIPLFIREYIARE